MAEFKLPKLRTLDKIVDALGRPSIAFVNFFLSFSRAIEKTVNDLLAVDQELIELNDVQDMLIEDLADAQEDIIEQQAALAANVLQIQALLGLVQGAAQAANDAQTTADEALGAGTVSGSNTDPVIDLISDGIWVFGPVVSLSSVLAGDLTFTGSGPIQDSDVDLVGGSVALGDFRLVEVVGGVDTVLFTGSFSANGSIAPVTITNYDATGVAAFVSARSSTGAVNYRIDARKTSGAMINSLALYIYARRAA